MTDPLEQVLAAESAAQARIEEIRESLESELRKARIDAKRITERNEDRTRAAVKRVESRAETATTREIERLERRARNQLSLGNDSVDQGLEGLVARHVDLLWPD